MTDKTNGFQFPFVVRETPGKGLGVFAEEAIKQGSIVWRHVRDQYVVHDEPAFKALIADMSRADVIYELTHVFGHEDFPGVMIRVIDEGVLVNHSSNANLITNNTVPPQQVLDETSPAYVCDVTEALLYERYALVATRDIEKGEEFTNDYNEDGFDPPYYDDLYEQYGIVEDYLDDE